LQAPSGSARSGDPVMSVVSNRRMSRVGNSIEESCAAALSHFESLDPDPAEIEDAVINFLPRDEPMRSQAMDTLAKMMSVDVRKLGDEDEMVAALVQAVTMRIAQAEAPRRSSASAGRVSTADETLDMIKLIIVGDSGVGKSCLMLRFVKDEFVSSTRATIGMDFCTRQLAVDVLQASESSLVQRLTVQVWDTAGQEQFHSLTATYYRKAGGVMIVYDAHSRASFEHLPRWLQQVEDNAEGLVKMVVAAKVEGMVAVSNEEGAAFARENGCLFASTSSKIGDGVIPAFKTLSSHVLAQQETTEEAREGLWLASAAVAENHGKKGNKKSGCC